VTLIVAGSALLLSERTDLGVEKPHLWLVLTDPRGQPPFVYAVMVRTRTRFTDDTLVLLPGDHPFIKHESSVHYSSAQRFRIDLLEDAIARGRCHPRDPMSRTLLHRVRAGLLASPYTVHAVRDACALAFGDREG
jgi:hypothetical protein